MTATETKATLVQHIRAPNDVNGNPRRCYVGYDADGMIVDGEDEGYGGKPERLRGLVELPGINVDVHEYRSCMEIIRRRVG